MTEYLSINRVGETSTMKKKKLCYFINSAWYFELHWLDRAKAALRAGYDITLISKFDDKGTYERLKSMGFECYDSQMSEKKTNPFVFITDFIRIVKILNAINPDVLHSITIKPGVIGCIWCKLWNKKLVYSFVGLGRVFESNSFLFKLLRFSIVNLYRNIFKHIECKFVFEHDSDRNKILNLLHLNRSKTVVIDGAGIDIDFFSFSEEPSREKVKVLFASRLLWSKGLSDLIAVKQKLHDSGTSFELLVAGIIVDDDKDAISLKQINIWNDKGDITWLGTRDDINELIKLSNVIVLPSIYAEGIPRILLEAGAVGRAVITYNIGGCNSLIKNGINGFVVEKKNIEQLSVKLEELIADKNLRARLGRNARRIIEAKYSSEIIIKKTLRVYGEFS